MAIAACSRDLLSPQQDAPAVRVCSWDPSYSAYRDRARAPPVVALSLARNVSAVRHTDPKNSSGERGILATKTGIQWTEVTWNPTTGCDRILQAAIIAMR